jgi:hypothetical protein
MVGVVAWELQHLLLGGEYVVADRAVLPLAAGSLGLDAGEGGDDVLRRGRFRRLVASQEVVQDGVQGLVSGEILWPQPVMS